MFRLSKDTEMTLPLLQEFLDEHKKEVEERYKPLYDAYMSDHKILHAPKKPNYKPDNRIVVNFPKYIVDTTNGFFIGNPIKTVADDKKVSEFVEYLEQYNDQDNKNEAISKTCSIYGKGYELYYTDEESELCIATLTPLESFMIFDDSIVERPLYFVRRYTDRDNNEYGSISNSYGVRYFKVTGGLDWLEHTDIKDVNTEGWKAHHFPGVPATEFLENEERQGIFEGSVLSMCNAYNKAISEKANDVDYFADAYMKKLGGEKLEDEDVEFLRDNRIIDIPGEEAQGITLEFMERPCNDTLQENHLNRLERLIFQIGQTANASDENFGTSSGIAMLYKMWNTSNRGKSKQRKFVSGMNRRYKLLFGHPASKVPADAWLQLHYQFTPNIPANLKEESEIAQNLEGITSHKTQLKALSIVDNVQDELDTIEEENAAPEKTIVDDLMFGKVPTTKPTEPAASGEVNEQ